MDQRFRLIGLLLKGFCAIKQVLTSIWSIWWIIVRDFARIGREERLPTEAIAGFRSGRVSRPVFADPTGRRSLNGICQRGSADDRNPGRGRGSEAGLGADAPGRG